MKYSHLIEPYLYGQLSPEEEVLFEKQLSRDPALAEETARRFNTGQTYPAPSENPPGERISSAGKLPLTGFVLLFFALLWWAAQTRANKNGVHNSTTEQHIVEPEVTN